MKPVERVVGAVAFIFLGCAGKTASEDALSADCMQLVDALPDTTAAAREFLLHNQVLEDGSQNWGDVAIALMRRPESQEKGKRIAVLLGDLGDAVPDGVHRSLLRAPDPSARMVAFLNLLRDSKDEHRADLDQALRVERNSRVKTMMQDALDDGVRGLSAEGMQKIIDAWANGAVEAVGPE